MKFRIQIIVVLVCIASIFAACASSGEKTSPKKSVDGESRDFESAVAENTAAFTLEEVSGELDLLDIEARFGDVGKKLRLAFLAAVSIAIGDESETSMQRKPANSSAVTDLIFDQTDNALFWTYKNSGDYDLNGLVEVADIIPIAENFLAKTGDGVGNDDLEKWLDGNGNGEVGISDVTVIALNYLSRVDGYAVYGRKRQFEDFEQLAKLEFAAGTGNYPKLFKFELPVDYPRFIYVVPFDSDGDRYNSGKIVDTGNRPPQAVLNVNKAEGIAPLTVTFDARSSQDEDGTVMRYRWQWREEDGIDDRFDNFRRLERTFGYPGEYDVTLFVRDNEGAQASATAHISVSGANTLYELEPNNGPEEASPLPAFPIETGIVKGSIGSTISLLGYSGDYEDWYSFSVPQSGFVWLYVGKSANIIYDGNDDLALISYDQGGPGAILEAHVGPKESAYLRVFGNPVYPSHVIYDIYGTFTPQLFDWNYIVESDTISEEAISSYLQNPSLNAVCIDEVVHAVFLQRMGTDFEYTIVYSTYDGSEWTYEPVYQSPHLLSQIILKMDSSNRPCIAFYGLNPATGNRTLNLTRKTDSDWNHTEIDTNIAYLYSDLGFALDNNDNAVMAFIDYGFGYLRIVRETSEGFSAFNTLMRASLDGNIIVDIDQENVVYVLYDRYSSSHVTLGQYDGVEYVYETISDGGNALDMAIDEERDFHLLYKQKVNDYKYNLYYAIGKSGNWITETVWDGAGYGSNGKILLGEVPKIAVGTKMFRDYADLVHYITRESGEWKVDLVEIMAASEPCIINLQGKDSLLYVFISPKGNEFHFKWAIRELRQE